MRAELKMIGAVVLAILLSTLSAHARPISWVASPSADVVKYRFYWELAPKQVTKASPYMEVPGTSFDTADVPEMAELDGTYNVGVTAVDDMGNESAAMSTAANVEIDNVLPDPPGPITLGD